MVRLGPPPGGITEVGKRAHQLAADSRDLNVQVERRVALMCSSRFALEPYLYTVVLFVQLIGGKLFLTLYMG